MSGDNAKILAGVKAGGTTGSTLAWFAPTGATAPTDAKTAPAVAFLDAGWCTQDGLAKKAAEQFNTVKGFGNVAALRKIQTDGEISFDLTFLETNAVTAAVYNRLPLTGTGSPTISTLDGSFSVTEGPVRIQRYAAIFDLVDGANLLRAYASSVEVTGRGDLNIKAGEPVQYPVTLTAYPDTDGVAVTYYYLVDALKAS